MFASFGSTAAINEGISRGSSLNNFTEYLNFFIVVLTVASSSNAVLVMLGGE